jgi:1-hydroxycarotenoid 3,4-desaturase
VSKATKAVVIGGGIGGLAAAIDAAAHGFAVQVLEKDARLGGKACGHRVGNIDFDSGPTVMTMPWVFQELARRAGRELSDYVTLEHAEVLARHMWPDGSQLDLFADPARSTEAIGTFAGQAEANAFVQFCKHVQRTYEAVEGPFIRSQRPTLWQLTRYVGSRGPGIVAAVDAHRTMWQALESHFQDPRLRQLFGRYATYVGSSPFEAPATLNLIAHVEGSGVWRVLGGMRALVDGLVRLATDVGVEFSTDCTIEHIEHDAGGVSGVRLETGSSIAADAVIFNGDAAALDLLTSHPRKRPSKDDHAASRSLSAVTWYIYGRVQGFPLLHHNVFFSSDYEAEFRDLFDKRRPPADPTVYLCAQDRTDHPREGNLSERLFLLINAPATGEDPEAWTDVERTQCDNVLMQNLTQRGLSLSVEQSAQMTPYDWARRFPQTGGAIYGARAKGAFSSLARPGARTRIPGLYLAGGSVHPGAGVPMAALSGSFAVQRLHEDHGSTGRFRMADTSGTTSTA